MTHATWPASADVLARASRHWGWMMAFGIISLLAGVAVLAWPGRTLIVVAVLLGIQLVVTGIFRFAAFASAVPDHRPVRGPARAGHPARAGPAARHLLGRQRGGGAVGSRSAWARLDRGDGRDQHAGRPAGPGLSGDLAADAGGRAERLAAGARPDGDHPGDQGPVGRAPDPGQR